MANNALFFPVPLLMTRPRASAEAFVRALPDTLHNKVTPIYSPLLRIAPRAVTVTLAPEDIAIFTSAHGVRFAPKGKNRKAYCVGPATTLAANQAGWQAINAGGNADAVVETVLADNPHAPLIHMSGHHTRGHVAERLGQAGLNVTTQVLYDQHRESLTKQALAALSGDFPVVIPLFSPRTAAQFATVALGGETAVITALSPAVAQALDGFRPDALYIAEEPTSKSMTETLGKALDQLSSG